MLLFFLSLEIGGDANGLLAIDTAAEEGCPKGPVVACPKGALVGLLVELGWPKARLELVGGPKGPGAPVDCCPNGAVLVGACPNGPLLVLLLIPPPPPIPESIPLAGADPKEMGADGGAAVAKGFGGAIALLILVLLPNGELAGGDPKGLLLLGVVEAGAWLLPPAGVPKGVMALGPAGGGAPNGLVLVLDAAGAPKGLEAGAIDEVPNMVFEGGCHPDEGAPNVVVVVVVDPKPVLGAGAPKGFGGAIVVVGVPTVAPKAGCVVVD